MSLWEDDVILDDSEARTERLEKAATLWEESIEEEMGPYSCYTFRRMKWEGIGAVIDGPGRTLRPFVSYVPGYIHFNPDDILEDSPPDGNHKTILQRLTTPLRIATPMKEVPVKDSASEEKHSNALVNLVSRANARKESDVLVAKRDIRVRKKEDFTEETAAICIQCCIRKHQSRRILRLVLVKFWHKKPDSTSGIFAYENKMTGEMQYVPPRLFKRLFPGLKW